MMLGAAVLTAVSASAFDVLGRRVPNALLAISACMALMVSAVGGMQLLLRQHVWPAAIALALGFALWRVGAWGGGDGKLLAVLGLWMGWAVFAALAVGLVAALLWVVGRSIRARRFGFLLRQAGLAQRDFWAGMMTGVFAGGAGAKERDEAIPLGVFLTAGVVALAVRDAAGLITGSGAL